MVEEIPKKILDRWYAVAWLDGWGEEWQRTAKICSTIWNAALLVARCWRTVDEGEYKAANDFLPDKLKQKPASPHPTAAEWAVSEEWMKSIAGLK